MYSFNSTQNQHFISQAEQRLNSINPNSEKKNQKIYKFAITDRENSVLKIENISGQKIQNNLSFDHLFRYDISPESKALQKNFESVFGFFESEVSSDTISLLNKLRGNSYEIDSELINLFAAKLLNFIRNPYCIKKVIDSFPAFKSVSPNDSKLKQEYEVLKNSSKPQKNYVCSEFGISESEYEDWLKILFILTIHCDDISKNPYANFIKEIFENPSYFIMVNIYDYDSEFCALSDRGFNMPFDQNKALSLEFNLTSNAFMQIIFWDVEQNPPSKIAESKSLLETYKHHRKRTNEVNLFFERNNLEVLKKYNELTIYQAFENVFCASQNIYGVLVQL